MGLVQPILDREITFSPLLTTWLQQTYNDWNRFDTLTVGKAKTIAAQLISADYKSGKFQTFYVDKIRGATIGEGATLIHDSMMQSGQASIDRTTISRAHVYYQRYNKGYCGSDYTWLDVPKETAYFREFNIQDPVNIQKPIIICVRKDVSDENITCVDLTKNGAYILPRNPGQYSFTATVHRNYKPESCPSFDFAVGMHCVDSVAYTDINGFKVKSPVLINFDNRDEYQKKVDNGDKLIECAGEYYRPRN